MQCGMGNRSTDSGLYRGTGRTSGLVDLDGYQSVATPTLLTSLPPFAYLHMFVRFTPLHLHTYGSRFCNCCWRQHFEAQINEGKARDLRCMAFKCGKMCEHAKVIKLLKRGGAYERLLAKYEQGYLGSFIEDNHNVRLCPSAPWCGRAIQVWSGVWKNNGSRALLNP